MKSHWPHCLFLLYSLFNNKTLRNVWRHLWLSPIQTTWLEYTNCFEDLGLPRRMLGRNCNTSVAMVRWFFSQLIDLHIKYQDQITDLTTEKGTTLHRRVLRPPLGLGIWICLSLFRFLCNSNTIPSSLHYSLDFNGPSNIYLLQKPIWTTLELNLGYALYCMWLRLSAHGRYLRAILQKKTYYHKKDIAIKP